MKILHITTTLNPEAGGVAKAIRDIIHGLNKIQLDIINEVVSIDCPIEEIIDEDDFIIHALGPAKTAWSYSSKLKDWLKNNLSNFDVIIIHGLWQYHSYVSYKLWSYLVKNSLKKRIKFFIMPHGSLGSYFQKAKVRRFKAIRNIIIWEVIEKHTVNNADAILFTSTEEEKDSFKSFKNYFPKKTIVVGLGIDENPSFVESMRGEFAEKVKKWNGYPFLLFLGRIDSVKGLNILISSFNKKYENTKKQLIIAGTGLDTPYGNNLRKIANDNIIWAGMLSGNVKWGALYCCEALILPSHHENFGIAIVEALASSKPVLISDKVSISKEIEINNAGLVELDTEEGVDKLLQRWELLSVEDKERMGDNAKNVYLEYFSIDKATEKMVKVLIDE